MIRTLLVVALLASATGPVFTVQDPRIVEASGMVDLGAVGTVVANDSGDTGRVFLLDGDGRTIGVTTYGDAVDVEALAPGGHSAVWVGDIGDNDARRPFVTVHRLTVRAGDRRAAASTYRLVYPDGAHDAETLLRDPSDGRLYIVTKAVGGGTVYAAPPALSANDDNTLSEVGTVPVWATDGAFVDPTHVLIRGYATATLFAFPSWQPIANLTLPAQPQGESLSIGPGQRVRIGTEGEHEPVLQVALPKSMTAALAPSASPAQGSDTPSATPDDRTVSPSPTDANPSRSTGSVAVTVGLAALIVLALVGLGALVVRRRS